MGEERLPEPQATGSVHSCVPGARPGSWKEGRSRRAAKYEHREPQTRGSGWGRWRLCGALAGPGVPRVRIEAPAGCQQARAGHLAAEGGKHGQRRLQKAVPGAEETQGRLRAERAEELVSALLRRVAICPRT